ncbi:hypothetical protein EA472_21510 [Natrarchaeobius oligotrophus]|uniref:Uncharacterized protein n=2 Tax=Natrarchaeobius TaxID=2501796 RepID=A0A3N6M523_NATCH|nr:hypothetical protein EA472_21510 [Natrarchaeobius chitinivorans]
MTVNFEKRPLIMDDSIEYLQENAAEFIVEKLPDGSVNLDRAAIEAEYSGNSPLDVDTWETIWAEISQPYEEPIYKDRLIYAVHSSQQFTRNKIEDAIHIGITSETLIEGGGEGDATVRLPGPRSNFEDHLSETDIDHFQSFQTWKDFWEENQFKSNNGEPDPVKEWVLVEAITHRENFGKDSKGFAAIGAGIEVGVLKEDGKSITLGSNRLPKYWRSVLEEGRYGKNSQVPLAELTVIQEYIHDISKEKAHNTIDLGIKDGLIYHNEQNTVSFRDPQTDDIDEISDAAFSDGRYPAGESNDGNPDDEPGDDESVNTPH